MPVVLKLTVQGLNRVDIILLQTEAWNISCVVRIHYGISDIRMVDTQGVTKFMCRNPQKIYATACSVGESFIFVKVTSAI